MIPRTWLTFQNYATFLEECILQKHRRAKTTFRNYDRNVSFILLFHLLVNSWYRAVHIKEQVITNWSQSTLYRWHYYTAKCYCVCGKVYYIASYLDITFSASSVSRNNNDIYVSKYRQTTSILKVNRVLLPSDNNILTVTELENKKKITFVNILFNPKEQILHYDNLSNVANLFLFV
jgi:hypothetical protein